ncbi:MAG: hypothetical protein KDA75_14345 [Planctomycetaceae bacterium]|nr:hypothetical protein [Planctomycetaceae bacterium]
MRNWTHMCVGLMALAASGSVLSGADQYGLSEGRPELQSIGSLAFGPEGILFAGDSKGAAVFALQTGDKSGDAAHSSYDVAGLNVKIAQALGSDSQQVKIEDVAVNPQTGHVFVSVTASGKPALVKVAGDEVTRVNLDKIPFAKAAIPDAPADKVTGEGRRARNNRLSTITDLAFVDGYVLIAGMRDAEAGSGVRSIEFPFSEIKPGTSLEIYHGAHGQLESNSPIRTFVPFNIGGEPNVLAGFTCTPLVRFPLSDLKPGETIRGTTVAELGNRNQPLDMIVYKKGGQSYVLSANSTRGVMKISTDKIDQNAGINDPIKGGGTAGQTYEKIEDWQGVVQLDKLNDDSAVVLVQRDSGDFDLKSMPLP